MHCTDSSKERHPDNFSTFTPTCHVLPARRTHLCRAFPHLPQVQGGVRLGTKTSQQHKSNLRASERGGGEAHLACAHVRLAPTSIDLVEKSKLSQNSPSPPQATSSAINQSLTIPRVWICRIWSRPASSGRPISTCTSRRPGRSSASSIMSCGAMTQKKKRGKT